MITRRHSSAGALAACLLALSSELTAQTSAGEKAAAETLFQSGVELTERGRVAEACEKFDASYQVEPALGTLFRLADCYDRIGRTASAWALFSEAQSRAQAAEQTARAAMAAERVKDLELRLSKLVLNVERNAALPGLELHMNGVVVPRASWGLPLPVDPGAQRLRLSAPGHRPWSETVSIEVQPGTRRVSIPDLQREEVKAAVPPKAAEPARLYSRWLGYSVGAAGLAGLGVAGIFGFRAYDLNQQSLDQCSRENANACTSRGKGLRDDAQQAATFSTAFVVAGGVLLAGGITLTLLQPYAHESRANALRLRTTVSKGTASAGLEGEF